MPGPDLSVIIAVYEQADTLPLVLRSLRDQDCPLRWELVVCDDGSAADYRSLLYHEIQRIGCDVRYVWQPHDGRRVAQSRNNAIRCARGDLLVFLDGDCLVDANFLTLHAGAHSAPKRLLCGSRKFLFSAASDFTLLQAEGKIRTLLNRAARSRIPSFREWQKKRYGRAPWRVCMSCNMSLARKPEVFFDEAFTGWGSEDVELACRLYHRHGYEVAIEPFVDCYTLEDGEPENFSVVRPQSHEAIVACVKDLLYFRAQYPGVDLQPMLELCRLFDFNDASGEWRRLSLLEAEARPIDQAVRRAETWFAIQRSEGALCNISAG